MNILTFGAAAIIASTSVAAPAVEMTHPATWKTKHPHVYGVLHRMRTVAIFVRPIIEVAGSAAQIATYIRR